MSMQEPSQLMMECLDLAVLQRVFIYDALATLAVFLMSVITRNSSCYDPYWSVAPVPIALYYAWNSPDGNRYRQAAVLVLIAAWGVRLTYNWAVEFLIKVGIAGQHKEDWRYILLKEYLGVLYWPVGSFLAIHAMPTVIVYLGCLPVHVAAISSTPLNWVDVVGCSVTVLAILIETIADEQMRVHLRSRKSSNNSVFQSGLWKYSRHPNYFGEILFWTGLYLIAVGSCPQHWWWLGLGPVAMVVLFLAGSIPLMESRQMKNKPGYKHYQQTTSVLVPWFK